MMEVMVFVTLFLLAQVTYVKVDKGNNATKDRAKDSGVAVDGESSATAKKNLLQSLPETATITERLKEELKKRQVRLCSV